MSTKDSLIAQNRKAKHDYLIEETFQAGIKLEGWEVKSIRAGKAQLIDSYVIFKNGEAFLLGALIQPLVSACTHIQTDPVRTRKLLLNKNEIDKLEIAVEQKGYTCVALSFNWDKNLVKCMIGLAKGKKAHDKRESERARDAAREIQAVTKNTRLRG